MNMNTVHSAAAVASSMPAARAASANVSGLSASGVDGLFRASPRAGFAPVADAHLDDLPAREGANVGDADPDGGFVAGTAVGSRTELNHFRVGDVNSVMEKAADGYPYHVALAAVPGKPFHFSAFSI